MVKGLTGHSRHVPILYSWGNRWRYNTASACFQKILSLESREQNLVIASKETDTNTKYTLRPSVKCYSGNFIIQIHMQARRTLLFLINRLLPWRSLTLAVHCSVYTWKYCHRYKLISQVMLMAYQSAATWKSVLYLNFRHQWIHTYGCLWYINGCTALCTCIHARVCTWCVYMW